MIRRAMPFLVFSLTLHAALLAGLLWWKLPKPAEPFERRVLLEFRRSPPAGPPARPPEPSAALPGLPIPVGSPLAVPASQGSRRPVMPGAAVPKETVRLTKAERPLPAAPAPALAIPAPSEALRGLLPGKPAPVTPAAPAAEAAAATGGYEPSTALEWEGKERTLLRGPEIRFPDLLLEKGLEAEVDVSYIISPSGQVVRVQITRSSGFASVDRAVEQALGNVLFAEAAGEDAGRIHIRFRLERKH